LLNDMVSGIPIESKRTGQSRIQAFAFILAAGLAVCVTVGLAVLSFSEERQSVEISFDERINPNDAPIESLIRLPGIGVDRAEAIKAYRDNWARGNAVPAFRNCEDLAKVKGLSPTTINNMEEFLKFE
jgi:DNA uptake protein ComE-like DNA-binding protein